MNSSDSVSTVSELMREYALLTGLDPVGSFPRRYLWTDAFAVCNYLELYRRTDDTAYRDLALHLVDQVHHVLGRHRTDGTRKGWISGLGEREGELHPTIGGLRIGKRKNERMPGEAFDEQDEWDRDGQYYHYLTKWMHALNRVSRVCGDPVYIRWAVELAKTAHARFTYLPAPTGPKRMVWKMSIDLSYPLVPSMGLHDPLDGLVTFSELQRAGNTLPQLSPLPPLHGEIADMAELCREKKWVTDDPLAIGGLLFDACRIAQLMTHDGFSQPALLGRVVDSALQGMQSSGGRRFLHLPAGYRLAFRELGLSIGVRGVDRLSRMIEENREMFGTADQVYENVVKFGTYSHLADTIEQFWLDERNQKVPAWTEHKEINMVMLATSLAPDEFLTI